MTEASVHAWHNGAVRQREYGAPSIASVSFHLGTGVFDGLMAYWNYDHYYIHRPKEHLIRFHEASARMGMPITWSTENMLSGIEQLLKLEVPGTQYIRPIAYRKGPELWVTGAEGRAVDVSIFTVRTAAHRDLDAPIRCDLSSVERISHLSVPRQTKVSGVYVNSFFARRTAEERGFDDAVMLDRQGRIAEASAANIFFIQENALVTPPLNPDVFPGITRTVLLEIAKGEGIRVVERDIFAQELVHMHGAFLCSTLMEVRPISCIGEVYLGTCDSTLYRLILDKFRQITHS